MEARNRTAGNRYEKNRKHCAELFICEARENRQIHCGVADDKADRRTENHTNKHNRGHIITGLFHKPNRHDCGNKNIRKNDIAPAVLTENDGTFDADCKRSYNENNTDKKFFPAGKIEFLLNKAENNGKKHEHDRNHAGRAVCARRGKLCAGGGVKGIKCARNHIGKNSYDKQ